MRFATFRVNDRTTYGIVADWGVIDVGRRLPALPTLVDLIRAGGIPPRQIVVGTPDYRLSDVAFLPPVPGAEKILCVGINYPERTAEYADNRERPKYPNLFVRFPGS